MEDEADELLGLSRDSIPPRSHRARSVCEFFDCDDPLMRKPLSIMLLLLWIGGIMLFVGIIIETLRLRVPLLAKNGTSTRVSMDPMDSIAFPAITVCNVARSVPLKESYCGSYAGDRDCPARFVPKGLPHCISYNNNADASSSTTFVAKKQGLADSVMLVLRLQIDKYPASARFSGVHVQLHGRCRHIHNECPEELASSLVAAPGAARFFRIEKVVHSLNNGSSMIHYEAKDSDAGDHNFEKMFGPRQDTAVLVFYYSALSQLHVTELPHYSFITLAAEMGGIMGLFFGVGFVNVVTWLLKVRCGVFPRACAA